MQNNLDEVLIDSLEEKPQKQSNKRILLIIIASVVLLGVLGVASLMLAKGESKPKNPEFSELEIELEKLSPTPKEEPLPSTQEDDDFNKLIADLKNQHTQTESKPHITQKPSTPVEKAPVQTPPTQKVNAEPIDLQLEPTLPPKQVAPKKDKEAKPQESKPQEAKSKKSKEQVSKPSQEQKVSKPQDKAPSKSASQLFQSVESSTPKGFYLQVGVFGGTPQKSFLGKLKNFSYKTDKVQRNGKVLTRYLIGPFPSKEIAQSKINQITLEINKPIIVEIR